MAAQTPSTAVAGRREGVLGPLRRADHDRRSSTHAATDENRLAGAGKGGQQVRVSHAEGARRALAMNEYPRRSPKISCSSSLQVLCETSNKTGRVASGKKCAKLTTALQRLWHSLGSAPATSA